MKSKIFLLFFCFILIFQLVKSQSLSDLESSEIEKMISNCQQKPSKAFTAVFLVYMFLIIIGAILVLILVKPVIEN